uniref:Uncharacterized protein n=1 Tax=Pseudo-nitzschia delicatissima TaxID=44447 RepID=A0A7S0UKJ2_9STRA|mmetsp:Transcript_33/g.76  ORF Transcript_33/g.76 Transcript_33/m.76 type:complete len:198 (+) Transcript_33:1-594(+)
MPSIKNTDDGYRTVQQGRISTSARSGTTTEDRFSSTSFSMEMGYPDSREISREFSIVASVVDEAQLEAEFVERMKSRIVEAVEIRPSITGDEEGTRSRNSYRHIDNNRGVSNSHSGSNSNSSDQEVVNVESAPEGDGNDIDASPGEETQTPSPTHLVRIKQRKQTIQGIVACTGIFLVIAILVVVLVLVFRASRSSK